MKNLNLLPQEFPLPLDEVDHANLATMPPLQHDLDYFETPTLRFNAQAAIIQIDEATFDFSDKSDESVAKSRLNSLMQKYKVVFDVSIRKVVKGPKMRLKFRKDVKVVPFKCTSARPTPYALREAAENELAELERLGIIGRMPPEITPEWMAPGMIISKDTEIDRGTLGCRLLVDNRKMNEFLERNAHPFESPKNLVRSIPPSAKYFISVDLWKGYFQLDIHPEDQHKTCFMLQSFGTFF